MLKIMIFIMISIIAMFIGYKLFYWLMILLLAMFNSDAVYDKIAKKSILELAKKDKVWKDVAKVLELGE